MGTLQSNVSLVSYRGHLFFEGGSYPSEKDIVRVF